MLLSRGELCRTHRDPAELLSGTVSRPLSDGRLLPTGPTAAMASLTQLPPEILHEILGYVAPEDLGPLLLTCRRFHNFVAGNSSLCKAIYLHHLVRALLVPFSVPGRTAQASGRTSPPRRTSPGRASSTTWWR